VTDLLFQLRDPCGLLLDGRHQPRNLSFQLGDAIVARVACHDELKV
jgi:hypothetical protein